MAKMKPGQISAKRAYEMSDALRKRADFDGKWANGLATLAKTEPVTKVRESLLKSSAKSWKEYNHNYEKSDRLKTRADAAMAKANAAAGRDTPLPASEGLFSKIKNWFE
jgi:hypothetical protein